MVAVTVGLVGCCILKPDKLVRIVFPYIRKRGNANVMFGYIISKRVMTYGLFLTTLTIVFQTVLVFLSNIFTEYPLNDNPYTAKSIEFDCYYLMNYSLVEEYSKAVLIILEPVWCFAINFNITAANGQATGALALSWLIVSVETWILLNVNNKIKKYSKNVKLSYCHWFIAIVTIGSAGVIAAIFIAFFFYREQWVYFLFQPENGLFILISWASLLIMDTDNVREPKTYEEYCRERVIQEDTPYELTQSILKEMIGHECKRLLASKTITNTNEDEMKRIVMNTFNDIISQEQLKLLRHEPIVQDTPTIQKDTPTINENTPTIQGHAS